MFLTILLVASGLSACGGGDGPSKFTIGGSITGHTATGLVLSDGISTVSPAANAVSFSFSDRVPSGNNYSVTIGTQPAGQQCTVTNGSGTIASANITNVQVTCVSLNNVGGTINGLTSPGLVLANGTDHVSPDANATSFTLPTPVLAGAQYNVTISTQPSGQTCEVTAGSGTVGSAAVTSVTINCLSPWVWLAGSNTTGATGVYGTLGVAAAGNVPGARIGAASWTDATGNFWLFGGAGPPTVQAFNDLWKFAPSTGLWTWVGGVAGTFSVGVYGTQGVASATNIPGSRVGAVTWTDGNNDFLLFGGRGVDSTGVSGDLNDLWRYSPATGMWTWIGGANTANSAGVSGTLGVADPANIPAARSDAVALRDSSGNVWLFGGLQVGSLGHAVYVNDMWMYSLTTGTWAWVSGTPNSTSSLQPNYGTKGVTAAGNNPGGRAGTLGWIDSHGDLWFFGGQQVPLQLYVYGDLWKFSPAASQWTWVGGSNKPDVFGTYGSEGTAAAGNIPGSRSYAASWTDASGNSWFFGGFGSPANPDLASSPVNAVWMFNPVSGLWTWISGSSNESATTGVYSTLGVAAPGDVPPGRGMPAHWVDGTGELWIFGGSQLHGLALNDLWKFTP